MPYRPKALASRRACSSTLSSRWFCVPAKEVADLVDHDAPTHDLFPDGR
jgi:hypothetical protein